MENTLQHLLEANDAIVSKFTVLSKQANEISSVITTITKVADQTNILSLNASIEAEKAGEYGRGFAVVAREIRRLADQAAVATLDIEKMVKEVQSAVSSGVEGLQALTTQVRDSYAEVGEISVQLGQIIERVQTLGPRFAALNQGIQAQSQNAQEVSTSIGELQAIAQEIADTLDKTNDDIEQLNNATQGLREEVARFTVSNTDLTKNGSPSSER
jgi:methyl-accepting chemotaxis protein WspA